MILYWDCTNFAFDYMTEDTVPPNIITHGNISQV